MSDILCSISVLFFNHNSLIGLVFIPMFRMIGELINDGETGFARFLETLWCISIVIMPICWLVCAFFSDTVEHAFVWALKSLGFIIAAMWILTIICLLTTISWADVGLFIIGALVVVSAIGGVGHEIIVILFD